MGNDLMAIRRRLMAARASGGLLPAEYQRVEWIASDGTAYVKSGYTPTLNLDKITWRYSLTASYTGDKMFFGFASDGGSNIRVYGELYNMHSWYAALLGAYVGSTLIDRGTGLNTIYDVEMTTTSLTVDGYTASASNAYSGGNSHEIFILAYRNPSGNPAYRNNSATRLYSLTFYEGSNVAANFVPCYRKSDGEIGMYDTVSKSFHGNADGSGSFTKGNDIT